MIDMIGKMFGSALATIVSIFTNEINSAKG